MYRNIDGLKPRGSVGIAAFAAALLLSGCAAGPTSEQPAVEEPPTPATAAVIERPAAPEGELPEELQARLQAAVEQVMADAGVPGAAAGVWIPGQGSWTTAVGLADIERDVAVTTDMTWPIRSITKSYTVTMILQLADEGALSLDDTIDGYVDGITNGDQITLLQLANMSSGNADYVNEAFLVEFEQDPSRVFSIAELNSFVQEQPPQFAPGTEYVYTNANTNLLGAVIEQVTGQSYAQALEERILAPLGQSGTHYIADVAQWSEPHAVGYQPDPDTGELVSEDQNPSILGAAGAMFSSLDDGRVWAVMLGSGAFLTPETQQLRTVGHPIAAPPYDLYAVGMGETGGWFGHNGEGIGFTAATFYDPGTGASIVVYMNKSNLPDGSHPADQAFRALAAVLAETAR